MLFIPANMSVGNYNQNLSLFNITLLFSSSLDNFFVFYKLCTYIFLSFSFLSIIFLFFFTLDTLNFQFVLLKYYIIYIMYLTNLLYNFLLLIILFRELQNIIMYNE